MRIRGGRRAALALALVLSLAVWIPAGAEQLVGGWTLREEFPAVELPEALREAFAKGLGIDGAAYRPILYMATQVVAGTNHLVLCLQTLATQEPATSLVAVVLYEDLQGGVSVLAVNDVNLLSLAEAAS